MDVFAVLDNPSWRRLNADELSGLAVRYHLGSSAKYLPRYDKHFSLVRDPANGLGLMSIPKVWRSTRGKGWHIFIDGVAQGEAREIDDEMAKLPIVHIIPGNSIIEKMTSGWIPQDEREDSITCFVRAVKESKPANRELTIFLDFDDETAASKAATDLERRGYGVVSATDGHSLSVTVRPRSRSTDWIEVLEEEIVKVASQYGGRYAGNEVPL